ERIGERGLSNSERAVQDNDPSLQVVRLSVGVRPFPPCVDKTTDMARRSGAPQNGSFEVFRILVVLADPIEQLGIGKIFPTDVCRPRLCVGLGIVDGYAHLHVAEVRPAEALDYVQCIAMRMAAIVEPSLRMDADGVHN